IIAFAAVRLARLTDGTDVRLWAISIVTLVVTAVTGTEVALLFVAAGLLMMVWEAPPKFLGGSSLVVLAAPALHGLFVSPASGGVLLDLGWFFLKAGAFIFGSGLAIVPFLREGVVEQHHWLSEREFLDAVAMGLITPGPVVITACFVGYVVAGFAGAAVATVAIFLPIYAGVVVPGRWFIRHQDSPRVQGFVKGATASAAGAIGGATIVLTRGAVVDWKTAAILGAAIVFVWRIRNREPILVLLAAVAGLVLYRA
ncbi:MAG TPA: chromate efflux transporter, partial [Actinomycetota bacterium]|nr:chromate efflux transporter [Actinomycetota bacterium]